MDRAPGFFISGSQFVFSLTDESTKRVVVFDGSGGGRDVEPRGSRYNADKALGGGADRQDAGMTPGPLVPCALRLLQCVRLAP